ncbi:MAG: DMT family transporter [Rhodobacter sp.]|jgi:transporter family-2 protein|nr:DMT family transporter [Rhodobacter sp.]
MTPPVLLALATLVAAGAVLSVQAPINAALARGMGDTALAACVSFLVGFLVMAVVCAMRGVWPVPGFAGQTPVWAWVGGTLGAFYITALIFSVPLTGALTAAAAAILGQLAMAMILDHFGALGLPVREISWSRIGGLVLVMAGLLLSRV